MARFICTDRLVLRHGYEQDRNSFAELHSIGDDGDLRLDSCRSNMLFDHIQFVGATHAISFYAVEYQAKVIG